MTLRLVSSNDRVIVDRRRFLGGLTALFVAPALVRVENIMRINTLLVPAPGILRMAAIGTRATYSWRAVMPEDEFIDPVRNMRLVHFTAEGDGFRNPPDYDRAEVVKVMRQASGKLDFTDNIKLVEWRDQNGKTVVEQEGVVVALDSLPLAECCNDENHGVLCWPTDGDGTRS